VKSYRLPQWYIMKCSLAVCGCQNQEARLIIFPYDAEAANWHAAERARLMGTGRTPPYLDGQIAAITIVNDLILVTNNTSDFADFQTLQLQNWFIP